MEDLAALVPAADVIPYSVRSPLWTDDAIKPRFLMVPPGQRITFSAEGDWVFPIGSVLIKFFVLEFEKGDPGSRRPVETRFMVLRSEGWEFFTYRWNAEGTDADLLSEGETVDFVIRDGDEDIPLRYLYPGRDACVTCHSDATGVVLGPRTRQMNGMHDYGGASSNQLLAMAEVGLFDAFDVEDADALPRLPDPSDETLAPEERARSYLDANCAHCHRPGGWVPPDLTLDLRYESSLAATRTCGVNQQYFAVLGRPNLRINPGSPETSTLYDRMTTTTPQRMPPVGTVWVDPLGARVVGGWIEALTECPE